MTRRVDRGRKNRRLVIRNSRELHREFKIVIAVIAVISFFVLLLLFGFDIKILAGIGVLVVFVGALFALARGPNPLYEVVADDEADGRTARDGASEARAEEMSARFEAVPTGDVEPSAELRGSLGPLATELHVLESELLEQAANGRFAARDVAALAGRLAGERAKLVGDPAPDREPPPAAPDPATPGTAPSAPARARRR